MYQRGLAVTVQPKSGKKTFTAIYFVSGFPRWYHIGAADAIGLADARKIAAGIMSRAATGEDPGGAAEGRAEQGYVREIGDAVRRAICQEEEQKLAAGRQIGEALLVAEMGQASGDGRYPRRCQSDDGEYRGPSPCKPSP